MKPRKATQKEIRQVILALLGDAQDIAEITIQLRHYNHKHLELTLSALHAVMLEKHGMDPTEARGLSMILVQRFVDEIDHLREGGKPFPLPSNRQQKKTEGTKNGKRG